MTSRPVDFSFVERYEGKVQALLKTVQEAQGVNANTVGGVHSREKLRPMKMVLGLQLVVSPIGATFLVWGRSRAFSSCVL